MSDKWEERAREWMAFHHGPTVQEFAAQFRAIDAEARKEGRREGKDVSANICENSAKTFRAAAKVCQSGSPEEGKALACAEACDLMAAAIRARGDE